MIHFQRESQDSVRRMLRRISWVGVVALGLAALAALGGPFFFRAFGEWWVVDEPLAPADAIIVLGGDSRYAERVRHAAALYRQGLAPRIILSGPFLRTHFSEAELMLQDARNLGLPEEALTVLPTKAFSTVDEALDLRAFLEGKNLRRLIIVTSNFHTRRSRLIFHAILGEAGFELRLSASPDLRFSPREWWRERSGQKEMVLEWIKLAENWIELWELRSRSTRAAPASRSSRFTGNEARRGLEAGRKP